MEKWFEDNLMICIKPTDLIKQRIHELTTQDVLQNKNTITSKIESILILEILCLLFTYIAQDYINS